MEKVDVSAESVNPKYKLEVTKNTKGYNYVVGVRGDDINMLKEEMSELETWAKSKYGN